ncbi:MAG: hypothetical protein KDE56_11100 [Anaerolineales bacterium]|nr:hypothetical protein [Anaerolineales bacterium]
MNIDKTHSIKTCFLGHSQNAPWQGDLIDACDKTLSPNKLSLWCAEDHFQPTQVLRAKVVDMIATAQFGIYDLSNWQDENGVWQMPRNVFIELGMAIALNRPTLLLRHTSNHNLPLPACLQGIELLEFAGTKTLAKNLEKRLPQWLSEVPEQDWFNRFCRFGVRQCEFREFHPKPKQQSTSTLHCYIADGVGVATNPAQQLEQEEIQAIFATVFERYEDVTYSYLDELALTDGYQFMLCSHCQAVRSAPFAIYRLTPNTPAEVYISLGISIGLEKAFGYAIPKTLLVQQEQDLPSLLRGYDVVEASSPSQTQRKLIKFLPKVINEVRQGVWMQRTLPFIDQNMLQSLKENESESINTVSVSNTIRILSIGRRAGHILNLINDLDSSKVDLIAVDNNVQTLHASHATSKLLIQTQSSQKLLSPSKAISDPNNTSNLIAETLGNSEILFVLVESRNLASTNIARYIAKKAKDSGIFTIIVAVPSPPTSKGNLSRINQQLFRWFRNYADSFIGASFNLDIEFESTILPRPNTTQLNDENLAQTIMSITDLIIVPGLINLDIDDLKIALQSNTYCFTVLKSSKGEDRASKLCQGLKSTTTQEPFKRTKQALFNVMGGADLSLYEINQVASTIRELLAPDANLIFGAIIDEQLNDELRVLFVGS